MIKQIISVMMLNDHDRIVLFWRNGMNDRLNVDQHYIEGMMDILCTYNGPCPYVGDCLCQHSINSIADLLPIDTIKKILPYIPQVFIIDIINDLISGGEEYPANIGLKVEIKDLIAHAMASEEIASTLRGATLTPDGCTFMELIADQPKEWEDYLVDTYGMERADDDDEDSESEAETEPYTPDEDSEEEETPHSRCKFC